MVFENAVDRLSQAVLVHTEVLFVEMYVGYLSYDCVLHLLVEHDKPTGKDFSLIYFKLMVQAT